ncbi:DUF2254 domain-containing protein [Streptococcus cameli]
MLQQIRLGYFNNKNFIRILSYSLLSVLLLIVTWLVDYQHPMLKEAIPPVLLLSTKVSTSFLSNLSGVFLTVSTFTLTTILTILNYYSNSFTPRIVQDFIDKPHVLSLFGIFIGGFFYSVTALFFLQNLSEDVMVISGTIAVFYAIVSMFAFVLFVRRVLRDIKFENVIHNVYQQANKLIVKEAEQRKNSERYDSNQITTGINIFGNSTGYLYDINRSALLTLLKDFPSELVITKKIGEYVPKGVYMATLYLSEEDALDKGKETDLLQAISNALIINTVKNESQDYHFELTNLIEIALKALSPGVNDPNTAISCIKKLALLLGQLFSTENNFIVLAEDEQSKIVYQSYSVEEEMYLTFNQILFYGKSDPLVANAILESVSMIYMISADVAKKEVRAFFDFVYEVCDQALTTSLDKKMLARIKENFETNRDNLSDKKAVREAD